MRSENIAEIALDVAKSPKFELVDRGLFGALIRKET